MVHVGDERPWITGRAYVSPWTYQANCTLQLPASVVVYDVTLRDGEQYPGLVFSKDDKLRLAEALDDLGISRLEAGMPAVSEDDCEAVRLIAKHVKADVVAFCRGIRGDVDLAADAGAWGVVVELPSNRTLIEKGYNWRREDVVSKAIDTCNYAKHKGLHTSLFLIDASGADPVFLQSIVKDVTAECDIDSLIGTDTFGRLNPRGTATFVQQLRAWSGVPVEIHVHNDFGLGVANSLAAVEAGAEVVHSTMLGLGERSGGVPTEEIAVALECLYGVDTGMHLDKLREVGRVFEEAAGITLPGHKPVIGRNSFTYEAGVAAMFSYRLHKEGMPLGTVPYLPELVGGRFGIVIGKKAGKYNILWKLEEAGKTASEEAITRIVARVKERAIQERRGLTETEFVEICGEVLSRL